MMPSNDIKTGMVAVGPRWFLYGCLLPLFASSILVALFADFLPVWLGNYAGQRFFQVFVLVAVSVFVLVSSVARVGADRLIENWPAFLVALSFLALPLLLPGGEYKWVEPGLYAFFFFAFALLGWLIHIRRCSGQAGFLLVVTVTVGCFFYGAMSLTIYAFAITEEFSKLIDVIPWGFVNMRYWSHVATWFLPLLPITLLYEPLRNIRLWRFLVFMTAGLWWWILLLTTARGSMIGLLIASVLVLLLFGRVALPWLSLSFRFFLVGVGIWCVLSWGLPGLMYDEVVVRGLHAGSSGRMPLWTEAWEMSVESFPLGMGPQSWLTHDVISEAYRHSIALGHPHNMYLMWAAEYGWLLIAVLVVLLGVTLKRLAVLAGMGRAATSENVSLLTGLVASAVAGFAHAGASAVFLVPASMSVGMLILAVLWAFTLDAPQKSKPFKADRIQVVWGRNLKLICAFFVLFGGLLWLQEVHRYHRAMEVDLVRYSEAPSSPLLPRFWLHGNFPRPDEG